MKRRIARLLIGPAVFGVLLIGAVPFVMAQPASAAVSFTSAAPYGSTAPSLGSSSGVASPGGTVSLSASGLHPSESCVVSVAGENIGNVTTSSTGTFTLPVTIPSNVAAGPQTITASCTTGDSTSFTIDVASAATAVTSSSSTTGSLAFTGADVIGTAGGGAAAIAIGGLLLLGSRRRRRSSWTS
jgi:hypothetical protein